MKHTPGPWKVRKPSYKTPNTLEIGAEMAGCYIPVCELRVSSLEQFRSKDEANAKLIAAAPELLEALRHLVDANPNDSTWNYPAALEAARQAIKKATE